MGTPQGADEVRARRNLRRAVRAFDVPAAPTPAGDWWDELYDEQHTDHHPDPAVPAAPAPAPRLPNWRKGETSDLRGPDPDDTTTPDPDDDEQPDDQDDEPDWEDVPDTPADKQARTARPGRGRRPAPLRRATAAYVDLDGRTRFALYNGSAAATGWSLGLAPLIEQWITGCQHNTGSVTTALTLAAGLITAIGILIDHRTRHWWGPLPWICRIPLASAVLAVLLYAPGATQ